MKLNFSTKNIPFLTKVFTVTFLLLVGYAIIAQTIVIPRTIASNYDQHLQSDFKLLSSQFKALSKSTELAVYNDPFGDLQKARTDLLSTQKLIAETELTLSNYEQRASTLQVSALAPYSEKYKKAEATRARTEDILLQSHEVITSYKELNAYLLQVTTARIVLKNNTAEINGLGNLNGLAGQGDIIAKRASQLRSAIATFKKVQPPTDYSAYHAALVVTFNQSAAGLEQISRGLYAASDPQINAGAAALEQAVKKYESTDNALFITASTHSPVLSETSMLADKADSLQPFQDQ